MKLKEAVACAPKKPLIMETQNMAIDIHDALKTQFSHDTFLEGQEDIIRRTLQGEELCVLDY